MNWWGIFFDEEYAHHFLPPDVEEQAGQLAQLLQLTAGQTVFDQCCGQGRYSRALAQEGVAPLGVDACAGYVIAAAEACPQGQFFCADASIFCTPRLCDAGFNVYSSFGYSADDDFNLAFLQRAAESLRPGALFVLETINFANVLVNFQKTLVTQLAGGLTLERRCRLDWKDGMLHQIWTLTRPDGTSRRHPTCTRMLLPRELGSLLARAGFEPLQMLGNLAGEAFAQDRPRVVWLARRS